MFKQNTDFRRLLEKKSMYINSQRGDIIFSSVDINEPFVQSAIDKIADFKQISRHEVQNEIADAVASRTKNLADSPPRMSTVALQNVVESVIFEQLKDVPIEGDEFDANTFTRLFNYILVKNKSFLKIKDPITKRSLKLKIIYTPQPAFVKQPEYVKRIETAAASPEGDLIFNTNFIKQLSRYAIVKNVKPKGKIYESNGGSIPDKYTYLEFLIMHEIYHIVHGDHFYQVKKKGMTQLAQNYLGDYITNAALVKAGYDQIPIGLFSNDYTYDKFDTMNDMQDAIIEDMKALSDEQKQNNKDQMDDHMDSNHDDTNGENGDGDGESEPGEGKGKSSEGEPSDGKPSDGEGDGEDDASKSIEDAMKKTDEDLADADVDIGDEGDIDEAVKKMKEESDNESAEAKQALKDALEVKRKKQEEQSQRDLNGKLKKPINWKNLIKKMFPKETEVEEESLARVHRRTRSQLATATDKSPISIKAGIVKGAKTSQSLMFMLDKSGSMNSVIDGISVELLKLINKNMTLGVDNMFVLMFDFTYDIFKIKIDRHGKKHTYQKLKTPLDIIKVPSDKLELAGTPKPVKDLFTISWGAGTVFPKDIIRISDSLVKQNFNQVLFTDTDIIGGDNLIKLKALMMKGNKRPFSFNIILDSLSTLNTVKQSIGGTYKYMSAL